MVKKRYWLWNALILALVFGFTAWSIAKEQNFALLPRAFALMRVEYIVAGALLSLLYVLCESIILKLMFWREKRRVSFLSCSRYSFIGYFFSAITPSASGGQPVEIYYMNRDGIPVSTSTPMLMVTTILYKIVLVALGVVFMAVGRDRMLAALSHSLWLFVLGFVLNALFIAFVLALLFKPALVRRFMHWLFGLRPLRRHDKMRERAVAFAEKYHESCELFTSRWKDALAWLLVSLLQRCIYLFLPYLVYRAFGMSGHSALEIMLLQGLIAISVDMLPLPGGMGASEHLFMEFFLPVFGASLALPGMLASRVLVFYFPLVVSALVTVCRISARGGRSREAEREKTASADRIAWGNPGCYIRALRPRQPETSCQGLFNQIHEKVTNKRLFFARTSLLPRHMGYNISRDKENLSSKE